VRRTRVLIVDDSALMRELLSGILGSPYDLEVVGIANDPVQALPLLRSLSPDVMTLDVEMPKQDGLSFLADVMRERPLPVVMVSSLTERGSDLALKALELGAIDVVEKPKLDLRAGVMLRAEELLTRVRGAATARPRATSRVSLTASAAPRAAHAPAANTASTPPLAARATSLSGRVIAIGASTGGTEALASLLRELPVACPPVVIVQHMPAQFTHKFATRLDSLCQIRVRQAEEGDALLPGTALLAPGGRHLRIAQGGSHYVARLSSAPEGMPHCPSVDVLFESVAATARQRGVGVILTGMGADGAKGVLAMRKAGGHTFAQDEASCVVFGMPKEAIARGGVERVLPLRALSKAAYRAAAFSNAR
jgi:two-component system, chemotaxis family, protein-glutamate methylesterase/glutaminase